MSVLTYIIIAFVIYGAALRFFLEEGDSHIAAVVCGIFWPAVFPVAVGYIVFGLIMECWSNKKDTK